MTRATQAAPASSRRGFTPSATRRSSLRALATVIAAVAGTLWLATAALAAQVHWEKPGKLAVGQRAGLDLVFEGTAPSRRVDLPDIDGLTVLGAPSQGSNVSIVNGRSRSSFTLSYPVRAEREGEIEIPSFDVATDQGVATVPATTVTAGRASLPATTGRGGQAAVTAQIVTSERRPYAGEVFDVDVLINLNGGRRAELVGKPTSDKQQIVVEPWHDAEQVRGTGSVRLSTRAMAPKAGTLTLAPMRQEMNVETGRAAAGDPFAALRNGRFDSLFDTDSLFDSFFGHSSMTNVTVATDPVTLDVQPLPPAPAGFTGAVGQFTLESKLVPENPKAGDPVTWTLTVRGTGNWSTGVSLPAREIPNDFRTLQPKQKRDFAENELFTGSVSEDLVLVPTQPGTYHFTPVRFTYFDPDKKAYQTVTVEPPVLQIGGSPVSQAAAAAAPNRGQSLAHDATVSPLSAAKKSDSLPLSPPSSWGTVLLPRDPIRGASSSLAPLSPKRLATCALAPVVLLAGYWLFLAFRHARLTDPRRRRREALDQLRSAIARARRAGTAAERAEALLAWQQATAIVLEVDAAAPTPAHLRRKQQRQDGREGEWIALWAQSDGALYGPDGHLDPKWYEQAIRACRHIRRPRHNPLTALLPRNLLARAAAVALVLVVVVGTAGAESTPTKPVVGSPEVAYGNGDFAAAQQGWRTYVQTDPSDWVARYNLGLADAQLGAVGQALGETAAAFLHHPAHESVHWNLNAFGSRVPGADGVLRELAAAAGAARLARVASPAAWQALLVAGVAAFCLGSAMHLRRRYRHDRQARGRSLAFAPLTIGAIIGLAALVSLRTYGALAVPTSALVAEPTVLRSVPTDAQDAQQHKPVAPGAVVLMDRQFLGWTRVMLASGERGWLRATELVPFYAAPEFKKTNESGDGRREAEGERERNP